MKGSNPPRALTLPGMAPQRAPYLPPEGSLPDVQAALLDWFATHQRPLPWRADYAPYSVWISEIMLQQTQMERGVDYFRRWMARFPDILALAAADEEAVLRQWEGLGYYSRARNVLAAARRIRDEHGGVFPSRLEDIRALPGVGPYTAAAVASIAFGADIPCVDANVERVVARLFDVDSPVRQEPAAGRIRYWAGRLVPPGRAREHNQAMMELGALVCRKKPRCTVCPLAAYCTCRHLGLASERPVPGRRPAVTPVEMATGVLVREGRVFVQKRCPGDVWAGLWEFPGGCVEAGETPREAVVREYLEETGFTVRVARPLGLIRHGYTTYRIAMHCFSLELDTAQSGGGTPAPPTLAAATAYRWVTPDGLGDLPMSAAHRKLAGILRNPAPGHPAALPGDKA